MNRKKTGTTKQKVKNGICHKCTGLCCRYFALPIDKPKTRDDFDDIRWYLCHKNVTVFVEKRQWYLNVINRCKYLRPRTHECAIYDKRPKICRGYKTGECDFSPDNYDHELHFTCDRQMEEYMKTRFGSDVPEKPDRKKKKRRKKPS